MQLEVLRRGFEENGKLLQLLYDPSSEVELLDETKKAESNERISIVFFLTSSVKSIGSQRI